MLMPEWVSVVGSTLVALAFIFVLGNVLVGVIAYCILPIASLCLYLFGLPTLMHNLMAGLMVACGLAVYAVHRLFFVGGVAAEEEEDS